MASRRGVCLESPSEEDCDYDPMKEAYTNNEFNSYSRGPGSYMKNSMHVESRRRNDSGNVKLHVTNVPMNINEKGLKGIFSKAGVVESVFISNQSKAGTKTKWAFIEYKTVKEAHQAIYEINNVPPHCLNVKFAHSEEKKMQWQNDNARHNQVEFSSDDSLVGGRGRGLLPPLRGEPPKSFKSTRVTPEVYYDQDQIDDGYTRGQFHHHNGETPEDYANEVIGNNMTLSVSMDGTRKVSMGRGSINMDHQLWRPPRPMNKENIKNYVQFASFTERYEDVFMFSNDETLLSFPLLKCTYCGNNSRKKCYNCGRPYCSKKCVNSDWRIHKEKCFGVKHDSSWMETNVNGDSTTDIQPIVKEERVEDRVQYTSPEKRERNFGNRNANITTPTVVKKGSLENPDYSQQVSNQSNKLNVSPGAKSPNELLKASVHDKQPCSGRNLETPSPIDKSSKVPEKQSSPATTVKTPIPIDRFTKVCICYSVDESTYWVIAESNIPAQMKMTSDLNEHCNGPTAKILYAALNSKCAALYAGEWFRGKVKQIKPNIVVQFIDFGNIEICQPNEIMALPQQFLTPSPMAFCITLAEGTSNKYKNLEEYKMLSIKIVKKENNAWVTEVEGESYPNKVNTSVSKGPSSRVQSPHPQVSQVTPMRNTKSPSVGQECLPSKTPPMSSSSSSPRSSPSFKRSKKSLSPGSSVPNFLKEELLPDRISSTPIRSEPLKEDPPRVSYKVNRLPTLEAAEEHMDDQDCPIPFDSYTEVQVSYTNKLMEYWVYKTSDLEDLYGMTEKLKTYSLLSVTSPVIGETYVCYYSDVWCRARVISLEPLKVFYIDFGNEEIVKLQNLKCVPPHFCGLPPYAFPIKLVEGTSKKYITLEEQQKINIKPLFKVNNGCWLVIIEGETYETLPVKQPSFTTATEKKRVKHLLSNVADGMNNVELIVNKVFSEEHLTCTLQLPGHPDSYSPQKIEQHLRKLSPEPVQSARLGDPVCCVTTNGVTARGYIMSVLAKQYRVALTDYARVCPISRICSLPDDIQEIPETGVRLVFNNEQTKSLKKGDVLKCTNIVRLENEFEINIYGMEGKASLSVWEPRVEEGGLSAVEIPSGSSVVMSSFKSPQAIYVQSLIKEHIDNLNTVIQDTASYALKAGNLNRKPLSGEIVACLFLEDNNYYRGQIIKRVKDIYTVTFLDYGNTTEASINDLKPLEDSLKMVPCSAVKVSLKGVNNKVLNPDAMKYLNNLSNDGIHFILEYENNDLSSATLETKDGLNLNNKLNELIDPNWKKCLEEGKDPTDGLIFMAGDVKYLEWNVGSPKYFAIISTLSHNKLMVLDTEDGSLEYISDKLTEQLTEYSESFKPDFSYNPRRYELCIAKYREDGKWYRAICMSVFKVSSEIFFVDFGNNGEVSHRDIRQMTPDFIKIPVILKKCYIYGVPDNVSESSAKMLKDYFCENSLHQAIITEEFHNGTVTAYIPGLIPKIQEFGIPDIFPPPF